MQRQGMSSEAKQPRITVFAQADAAITDAANGDVAYEFWEATQSNYIAGQPLGMNGFRSISGTAGWKPSAVTNQII